MPLDFWTGYWAFVAFVFGAIVGSFLNVCIWRLPRGESLSDPPSHCPACGHRLRFLHDMTPLLSQLWHRSRCRYCKQHYSWRYFWVEMFTAVIFTAVYFRYVPFGAAGLGEVERNWSAFTAMIFAAALITIFFIDLEHYEIPDVAVLVAVVAAVARDLILIRSGARPLWQPLLGTPWSIPVPLSIIGALAAFWLLWQFAALTTAALGREAMGAGDSLLLAAMGAFLIPWPLALLSFVLAVALGTVGGVAGMWLAAREPAVIPGSSAAPVAEPGAAVEGEIGEGVGAAPDVAPDSPPLMAVEASGAAEAMPGHRGAAGLPVDGPAGEGLPDGQPDADDEPEVPTLPPGSRWGRLWTVIGSWIGVGALWGGAYLGSRSPAQGITFGLLAAAAAAVVLFFGIRQWVHNDREWLPAMDEFFEGDPGPRFIPFGPYLVAGTLLAMLFGRSLIELYAETSSLSLAGLNWN